MVLEGYFMECEDLEKLISGFIDDELPKDKKEALEKHLQVCNKCRADVEEFKKIDALLKVTSIPEPSEQYWREFEFELKEKINKRKPWWKKIGNFLFTPRLAPAFALLFILLLFFPFILKNIPVGKMYVSSPPHKHPSVSQTVRGRASRKEISNNKESEEHTFDKMLPSAPPVSEKKEWAPSMDEEKLYMPSKGKSAKKIPPEKEKKRVYLPKSIPLKKAMPSPLGKAKKRKKDTVSSISSQDTYLSRCEVVLLRFLNMENTPSALRQLRSDIKNSGFMEELKQSRWMFSDNPEIQKHIDAMIIITDRIMTIDANQIQSLKRKIVESGILERTRQLKLYEPSPWNI